MANSRPTLLAAAGSFSDPRYPSDGMDLRKFISKPSLRRSQKLFWRYKANRQRAMIDGEMKYLKIPNNRFLFNVQDDPRERANLKDRQPATFLRLEREWLAWSADMLPERRETFTEGVTRKVQADDIGATASDQLPDLGN